jgi:hypothetical protein
MADDDKQPMQADGSEGGVAGAVQEDNPPSAGRPDMKDNPGQSGGGPYPNPHTGEDDGDFHGGQTEAGYFGGGQGGAEGVSDNDNAVNGEG